VKGKYTIGILILLLLTFIIVSTASASTTFEITKSNIYSGAIPEGASIKVEVTYDGEANTITFVDKSVGLDEYNPRLTWVAYNIDQDATAITGYAAWGLLPEDTTKMDDGVVTVWTDKENFGALGDFANFLRVYAVKNPKTVNQFKTVVVQLPADSETFNFDGTIDPNSNGYEVGVHFVCDRFSGFVVGSEEPYVPEPYVPIPEFPTVALPFAVILGIMFILGSRKKE
jgi:hypothetical protein